MQRTNLLGCTSFLDESVRLFQPALNYYAVIYYFFHYFGCFFENQIIIAVNKAYSRIGGFFDSFNQIGIEIYHRPVETGELNHKGGVSSAVDFD
ncbi:MAG: hypothetical protein A2X81_16905 [Desulfobacterales bacterium GWB2_56_26]|nr:MAG: hypothetical protein A2X81_16905 [Desulfobacterales bacterium GWB2_56_26]